MQYINFDNKKISKLGIDITSIIESGDELELNETLKLCKDNGINFFNTSKKTKPILEEFLSRYYIHNCNNKGYDDDFVEVNYFDWSDDLKHKLSISKEEGKLVIAKNIEADGRLVKLSEYDEKLFKKLRPWESTISWAVRWVMNIKEVDIIMCKVDSIVYLEDLVHIFNLPMPLDSSEWNYLIDLGKKLKDE